MQLILQRRHNATCPDKNKGPNFLKCRGRCRFWAYGCEAGDRRRISLKTSDRARADRRLAELNKKDQPVAPAKKTVAEAREAFLAYKADKTPETLRKYARVVNTLQTYCDKNKLKYVASLTLEALDPYIQEHRRARIVWHKHVEILRTFFRFCVSRKWCDENPASEIALPKLEENEEIVPYTREEVARMIAASDYVGKRSYERLRARAYVLLLRFTGMRISDVVTLSREHIQDDYIVKRAIKNKRWLRIQIPPVVRQALEVLPHPLAAPRESKAYFAGQGSLRSLVKSAERLLWSVFQKADVRAAYPHRFRHTFASELLARGESIEVVADLLGDSPTIVRKHYRKWMPEWQAKKDMASRGLVEGASTNLPQIEKTN
jgi:site-specific recombinase XerD